MSDDTPSAIGRAGGAASDAGAALPEHHPSALDVLNDGSRRTTGGRRATDRYLALVAATAEMVWLRAPDGAFVEPQPGWSAFTGQGFDAYRGHGWLDAVHPDDRVRAAADWQRSVDAPAVYLTERRVRRHDGAYRWLALRAVPITGDDGRVREWVGMETDVTEQRLAEERATRLLSQMSDAHIAMDRDFRILTANPSAERAVGMSARSLVGRTHWEAFPASVGSAIEDRYRRVAAAHVEAHFTHHYVGDGYDFWLEIDAYPDGDGGVSVFWRDVTERVLTADALARQAALTQLVASNATAALFMMDAEGHPTYMNPAAEAMTGYTLAEIAGLPLHYAIHHRHPDGTPHAMADCPIDRALPENSLVRAHGDVFVRRDGTFFPVVCAASPILENGVPVGTVVEVRDVTREKEAEASLREMNALFASQNAHLADQAMELEISNQQLQEQAGELEMQAEELEERSAEAEAQRRVADAAHRRMREVLESITDPFFTVDHDWNFTYINPAAERVVGRARDSLLGKNLWTEFREAMGLTYYENAMIAAREHRAVDFEAYYPAPLDLWTEMRIYPLGTADAPEGVAVYYQDVSARKRAEAELRASERRLRDVFEQAPLAVAVLTGPEHVYTVMSPRYAAFLGRRPALGLPFRVAVPEASGEELGKIMDHVYETGEPFSAHERLVRIDRDGDGVVEDYYFNVGYQPLRDAASAVYAVASVSIDVTEHVLARRELETARAAAEAANAAKSQFLSTMSHELRTPLNAIQGYAELLSMGIRGPTTDAQQDDFARIGRASQHLMSLITDILNFARLDAGQVEFHIEDVPLAPLVADLEVLVGRQIAAKQLRYDHDACAPDTPDRPHLVRADPEKLRQVLLNLLTNAVKFTAPGGSVALACETDADAPVIRVRVHDTGRGIPPDQLERVFEPFVQIDRHRTHESQQGVGLGLAISRDLARRMGGDLTVTSTVDEGSTFTLTLPRA
jgi:PAS domain S-box-containing protein